MLSATRYAVETDMKVLVFGLFAITTALFGCIKCQAHETDGDTRFDPPKMIVIPSGEVRKGCVSGIDYKESEFPVQLWQFQTECFWAI